MTVRLIEDGAAWDRFLDETPHGTIFHRWKILKIVEKYSGYQLLPYGIYRGAELISVFPLYLRKYRGMKLLFSPPPRTLIPYLSFVMGPTYEKLKQKRKEAYLAEVAAEITAEIRKIAPNYVTMLTEPCFDDIRPFIWEKYGINISYEYAINLEKPLEEIWAGFDSTCKKNIKHCEGRGLVMKQSDDIEAYYRVMRESFDARGRKSFYRTGNPAYLKEILEAYPEYIKLYFLYEGDAKVGTDKIVGSDKIVSTDRIVGTHLICEYRGKFILWLGSASGHYNEYMLWELIKMEKAKGMKVFEIPDADTRRILPFKSKFNPGLEMKFQIHRKDTVGAIAEWTFSHVVKSWI